jgi:hypothetical protein
MHSPDFEHATNDALDKYVQKASKKSLGSGAYNFAFRLFKGENPTKTTRPWVIKWPLLENALQDREVNNPQRACRKFRAINPDEPVFAIDGYRLFVTGDFLIDDMDVEPGIVYLSCIKGIVLSTALTKNGNIERISLNQILPCWANLALMIDDRTPLTQEITNDIFKALNYPRSGLLVPFYNGPEALDADIANAVIDIYLRTRNIILDACGTKNFLIHNGKAICIDVDAAYNRGSETSVKSFTLFNKDYVYTRIGRMFSAYWKNFTHKPKTISTIQTLLYLESKFSVVEIEDKFIYNEFLEKIYGLIVINYPINHRTLELVFLLLNMDFGVEFKITPKLLTELSALDIEDKIAIKSHVLERFNLRGINERCLSGIISGRLENPVNTREAIISELVDSHISNRLNKYKAYTPIQDLDEIYLDDFDCKRIKI